MFQSFQLFHHFATFKTLTSVNLAQQFSVQSFNIGDRSRSMVEQLTMSGL
jgi:hypothetical protein